MVRHPLDLVLFTVVLICLFVGRMIAWEVAPALEARYGLAPGLITPAITGMTIILGIIVLLAVYDWWDRKGLPWMPVVLILVGVLAGVFGLPALLGKELPVWLRTVTGIATLFLLFGICVYSHDKFQAWQRRRWAKLARRWAATGRPDNLRGADLRGADLSGVDLGASEEGGKGANLVGASLRASNLTGANLLAANLRDANLSAANLRSANLRDADLRDVDLQWASSVGADLRDADLRGADLRWSKLVGADLQGAKLEGCSLRHTNYDNTTHWPEGFNPPYEATRR
jgi:hypothetical protein